MHSLPHFDGERSREHRDHSSLRLWKTAIAERWKHGNRFDLKHYVQFIGFPRSGHSLVGAILDAHPAAMISHELDAMGLLKKGFSAKNILALIRWQCRNFALHGHYWNNFQYMVPSFEADAMQPAVYGDKKGDWTARHLSGQSHLIGDLQTRFGTPGKFIFVVRHPFDNISTLSLRVGRRYDQLRIESANEAEFERKLMEQQGKQVPDEIDPAMLDDYVNLTNLVSKAKTLIDEENWFEIDYEAFRQNPRPQLAALCCFLDLEPLPGYLDAAASLVNPKPNHTRFKIKWSAPQIDRVKQVMDQYSFFHRFPADFEIAS
ncbi:MAG: sulfotransferase [Planctomycetota bacterium]